MTIPDFAKISEGAFRRLPAAHREKIFLDADRFNPGHRPCRLNADGMWQCVKAAREAFWEGNPAAIRVFEKKDGITAAECNEWLSTLPPVSLYGEDEA